MNLIQHTHSEEKIFINACPTGTIYNKTHNQFLPITPDEIIKEALLLASLGAAILHIHARDEEGNPTWNREIYQKIISGIKEQNESVIICVSTSGRFFNDFRQRADVLDLKGDVKPDMASLTLGSLNFMKSSSLNDPKTIIDLSKKMLDEGIKPEIELFDTGMLNQMHVLIKNNLLKPPYYVNLMFGNIYTMQLDLQVIDFFITNLPKETLVGFGGIGKSQFDASHLALALNKGVRIGLEDNLYLDKNKNCLATNSGLVSRTISIAHAMNKKLLTPSDVRGLLEL